MLSFLIFALLSSDGAGGLSSAQPSPSLPSSVFAAGGLGASVSLAKQPTVPRPPSALLLLVTARREDTQAAP